MKIITTQIIWAKSASDADGTTCGWAPWNALSMFTLYQKGIDLDPAKTKAIQDIWPHTTCKQLTFYKSHVTLAVTECYTKWVEAAALWQATKVAIPNFICDSIFYQFGIPNRIISDNGPPFINIYFCQLTEEYGVDHVTSSLYNPKNSHAEATNKILLKTQQNGLR